MKCDLSEVWKLAISIKEWREKELAFKAALAEEERISAQEKARLEKEGWRFKTESFTHPHNNDERKETSFASPRMSNYRTYYPGSDFLEEEAKALASVHSKKILPVAHELIEAELQDYFYENPTATQAPPLNIHVTNALPSRQQ